MTIAEEAGIDRHGEPVQVSLPFAAGALNEPVVAIHGSDGPIESQFEVLARWGDGSIRWLLARFFVDVPAGGGIELVVRPGTRSAIERGAPLASKDGNRVALDNGAIRAVMGAEAGDSFLVTDSAGQPLLASRPSLAIYAYQDGAVREHRCLPPDIVRLEENGPLYASVFVAGPMRADDAASIFRYETRLHFWRGKRQILAEHTIVSIAGPDVTIVDGVVVKLAAKGDLERYVLGGQSGAHSGRLAGDERVRLHQSCAHCVGNAIRSPAHLLGAGKGFRLLDHGGRSPHRSG